MAFRFPQKDGHVRAYVSYQAKGNARFNGVGLSRAAYDSGLRMMLNVPVSVVWPGSPLYSIASV